MVDEIRADCSPGASLRSFPIHLLLRPGSRNRAGRTAATVNGRPFLWVPSLWNGRNRKQLVIRQTSKPHALPAVKLFFTRANLEPAKSTASIEFPMSEKRKPV